MDSIDARMKILSRIASGKPKGDCPLPVIPEFRQAGNPVENFMEKLRSFDGRVEEFPSRAQALERIGELIGRNVGKNIFSSIEGIQGNVRDADVSNPHDAAKIDICITESDLGVGEMGSLWVTDESLRQPACGLLCLHLYVLVDAARIVGGMHEAYACLDIAAHAYGSFFTGPSATADIEAVHITGAQGPLSLTALVYNVSHD